MNFTSPEFLIFFPVVCILYWKISDTNRKWLLLAASYLFYMSWKPLAAVILFLITWVTYTAARKITDAQTRKQKQVWRWTGMLIPLLALILFKNAGFWLVAGISFYTFQALSYVLDVYQGRISAEEHFSEYALYISFFPQLVAGPIERPSSLMPQLKKKKMFQKEEMHEGIHYLLRGFFKKLVIADVLAVSVNQVFLAAKESPLAAWTVVIGAMLFALQIYGDFSGYSDIAKGCALLLGIRLMDNFDRPYLAKGIGEFWRRWHISLTSWFTDYVYKPLGGSRRGLLITCRNILLVFLLSGIWHGYGGHFLLWGLLHGVYMMAERLMAAYLPEKKLLPDWCKIAGTFLLVCFAWIFFRAESVTAAFRMIRDLGYGWGLAGIRDTLQFFGWKLPELAQLLLSLIVLFLLDAKKGVQERAQNWFLGITIVFTWLMLLSMHQENAFIYFRF